MARCSSSFGSSYNRKGTQSREIVCPASSFASIAIYLHAFHIMPHFLYHSSLDTMATGCPPLPILSDLTNNTTRSWFYVHGAPATLALMKKTSLHPRTKRMTIHRWCWSLMSVSCTTPTRDIPAVQRHIFSVTVGINVMLKKCWVIGNAEDTAGGILAWKQFVLSSSTWVGTLATTTRVRFTELLPLHGIRQPLMDMMTSSQCVGCAGENCVENCVKEIRLILWTMNILLLDY